MKKKISCLLILALGFTVLVSGVSAAAAVNLNLANTTGDNVRVSLTGDPSTSVRLSFLPPGASSVTTIAFGTTDASGNYASSISSGGYGIPSGSPVYATVNGRQSATLLWPSYTSSLTLSKSSANVALGQSQAVTGSTALILAANGFVSGLGTVLNGSQLTVTGLANGTGTLWLCGANVGCASLVVTVGGEGQSEVSFSQNNFTLLDSQTKIIDIYGGTSAGFTVSSNSNPDSVQATISGTTNKITLYGKHTPGAATIVVCAKGSENNCASLNATTLNSTVDSLTFSQNNITLNPGLTQRVTVSGGPDNNYYISSNSNSGAVSATISGNILTVVGGGNAGSSVVAVCSTTVNATCGNFNVTLALNNAAASETSLSFSQNVVTLAKNETTNVTVNGGSGSGYVVSSNSNPTAATANVTGGTNIIAIFGAEVGSTIVNVCSATSGSVCASIYVTVGPELAAILFSQNSVALSAGNKLITVTGGSGAGKVISLNTNPSAVTATLNADGGILTLKGGTVSGSAAITVCSSTYDNNCATLNATYTAPAATTNTSTATNNASGNSAKAVLDAILAEAGDVVRENGLIKDAALESKIISGYVNSLTANKTLSAAAIKLIVNFIAYGTPTTKTMGAGERAGVLNSYLKAFSKLPINEDQWIDAIKIANGRWPGETNSAAINSAKSEFRKVYKREADLNNQNDNAAVSIIAYGLRPTARNTNSEKAAILSFKAVYGHAPVSALAWDIVRAIAYSGAKR